MIFYLLFIKKKKKKKKIKNIVKIKTLFFLVNILFNTKKRRRGIVTV
jgi:hypothetical protein